MQDKTEACPEAVHTLMSKIRDGTSSFEQAIEAYEKDNGNPDRFDGLTEEITAICEALLGEFANTRRAIRDVDFPQSNLVSAFCHNSKSAIIMARNEVYISHNPEEFIAIIKAASRRLTINESISKDT